MASTAELVPYYPLRRGRWRRRWRPKARWTASVTPARIAAVAVLLAAGVLAGLTLSRLRDDPRRAYGEGLAAWHEGRLTDARTLLARAVALVPGPAEMALAGVAIDSDDGPAAETALQRAEAAGVPASRLHGLQAASLLLGGDADGALAATDHVTAGDQKLIQRVRARALDATGDSAGAERTLVALLAGVPTDAAAWVDLGRVRLGRGDVGGAGAAAARAVALDPRSPAALTLEGDVTRSRYGPSAAIAWYQAALARDPRFVAALQAEAAVLGEVGRVAEALAAARAVLAIRPAAAQPRYLMAVIAARAGDAALARRMLGTMDDAADAMPGVSLLGGWIAQAQGHDDLAVARWQPLLAAQPLNDRLRRLLGLVLLRSGDAQSALDTLAPIVARRDADSESLELAARAARATGDPRAANWHDRAIGGQRDASAPFATEDTVATLTAAAAADPGDPFAAVALVRGLLASGDVAAGVTRARDLAMASPGAAPAQLALGDALAGAGRYGEAATVYARAADLGFDEPTMLRLVDALGRAGRARQAADAVALYWSQNPQSLVARRLAGHWQAAAGDSRATATLEALRRDVGVRDAGLLADLALAWSRRGDPPRARRYAAAAYRLAPMNRGIVQLYAAILARAGDRDGAHQLTIKAAALARG